MEHVVAFQVRQGELGGDVAHFVDEEGLDRIPGSIGHDGEIFVDPPCAGRRLRAQWTVGNTVHIVVTVVLL